MIVIKHNRKGEGKKKKRGSIPEKEKLSAIIFKSNPTTKTTTNFITEHLKVVWIIGHVSGSFSPPCHPANAFVFVASIKETRAKMGFGNSIKSSSCPLITK